MPTTAGSTARGFPYPGDTGPADGPAAFKALADAVEAEFDEALALGSTLTVQNDVTVQGTEPHVNLKDTDASANLKYSRLRNATGHTYLLSMTDDGSSTRHVALDHDHNTGIVNFPTGVTTADLTASDDLTVGDDASVGGDLTVAGEITQTGRRGKSIIATTETRASASYGTLTTPDQVTVTLPTDGLLKVMFQATWQVSLTGAGRAAIFIGANQLKRYEDGGTAPVVQEAFSTGTGGNDALLATSPPLAGLASLGSGYTGDVTTGQAAGGYQSPSSPGGGPVHIFNLPAGSYTVSIRFLATTGSVTVRNRKLWVATEAY